MSTTIAEQARFDAWLPKEQKELFEKAAYLGGYRNLTDFVVRVVKDKAKEILKTQARQEFKRKISACLVLAVSETKDIHG